MLASFGKMPTTSARRLTSFSILARVVNYLIVPPACMRRVAQQRVAVDLPGGSLLYELDAAVGSGWGMGRSRGVLPYLRRPIPQQAMRAAKEMERTLPSPVPGGTSPAAWIVRPIRIG